LPFFISYQLYLNNIFFFRFFLKKILKFIFILYHINHNLLLFKKREKKKNNFLQLTLCFIKMNSKIHEVYMPKTQFTPYNHILSVRLADFDSMTCYSQ
jgi:hypothetical protein